MATATQITKALPRTASRQINAVVVSSGLMQKTVKVRIGTQKWDGHIQKKFSRSARLLVHDPASSVRTGDVISITPGWRVSKTVRHVVSSIIAPFGSSIESRPPVPTAEERIAQREAESAQKIQRRRERDLAIKKAEEERVIAEAEQEKLRRKQEAKGKKRRARAARDWAVKEAEREKQSGNEVESSQDQSAVSESAPAPAVTPDEVPEVPKKRGWFS
ncbi:ribosomal protein S17 [Phlyctema vagabunda]|uniref:Ribosomal protein S17 n=1 Tax=Phlyctema vagabunda TaxID=108571 RepID=A0ABR4PSK4_9HELO